jgi:hypothetical protein
MVWVWVREAPVIGRLETILRVAPPPPPAPPQAANSILEATNMEIKTRKRLDISYSSKKFGESLARHRQDCLQTGNTTYSRQD